MTSEFVIPHSSFVIQLGTAKGQTTTLMMASAAFAAAAAGLAPDFFLRGHVALFERLGDVAIHGLGDALEDLLSFDEGDDGRVRIAAVLKIFELTLLDGGGLFTVVALAMQGTAHGGHFTIQGDGVFIGEESLGLVTSVAHFLVGHDGFAEVLDAGFDGGGSGHRAARINANARRACDLCRFFEVRPRHGHHRSRSA